MAARTGDDTEYQTVGSDATDLQRYAEVNLESGEVIIYDAENEDAWIRSESAIGLECMA